MRATPHVLAVDDDPAARGLMTEYLAQHDVRVTAIGDDAAMRTVLERDAVDLILLDLKRRYDEALRLAERLRGDSPIPFIMLGPHAEEADRVMALEMGADDYLTKPYSPRELVARIRAVLRRRPPAEPQRARTSGVRAYRFDGCELNLNTRQLRLRDGVATAIGNAEFSLLLTLLASPQRVLSRRDLLDRSRLHGDEVYERSIDVQVMRLRRKVEVDPLKPRCIRTERGAGYILGVPVQAVD